MPRQSREEEAPYSQRAEWTDVVPVKQDDGPLPLAAIRYPPGFAEVHDYFRAVQQLGEYSERALVLTASVIEKNSANYTAWYYRRRCLKELQSDLHLELEFADKWARDCPKNYQVWYHRRWIISELLQQIKGSGDDAAAVERQVKELGDRELEYHSDVMQVNDDYKNYNGWSHRLFIVSTFDLWDKEMSFVEYLLQEDVRNNSAWNHRHTVVKNTAWPVSEKTRQREIDFTLAQLRKGANNESAWNYLGAYLGEGEGRVPWDSVPSVVAFVEEVREEAVQQGTSCRFAVEATARILEARGQLQDAAAEYQALRDLDRIRVNYWDWRIAVLKEKASKAQDTVE